MTHRSIPYLTLPTLAAAQAEFSRTSPIERGEAANGGKARLERVWCLGISAVYRVGMANILDVRTRKLADDRVEAIAITDKEDAEGAPVIVRGYGATPEDAIADARRKADVE